MSEYAGDNRLTNSIRFAEEAISSVPSIVVGLFGLIAFVNLTGWGYTALSGALALTLFNLPLMARLTEQALRAVPQDERAASLALGATKWQTIRHVVLPLAIPGIMTGIILTAGRVFGEAAVLLFTAGQSTPTHYDFTNFDLSDPSSPWSPFRPATTLAGLHLEEQLRGSRQLRDRRSPTAPRRSCWGPSSSSTSRPGLRALPDPAPDRRMNEDESMTAARHDHASDDAHRASTSTPADRAAQERPTAPALSTVMKMAAEKLSVTYGDRIAVREVTLAVPGTLDHGPDRAVGQRQEHRPALLQPDERPDPRCRGHRLAHASTARTSCPRTSTSSSSAAGSGWSSSDRTRSR